MVSCHNQSDYKIAQVHLNEALFLQTMVNQGYNPLVAISNGLFGTALC